MNKHNFFPDSFDFCDLLLHLFGANQRNLGCNIHNFDWHVIVSEVAKIKISFVRELFKSWITKCGFCRHQ